MEAVPEKMMEEILEDTPSSAVQKPPSFASYALTRLTRSARVRFERSGSLSEEEARLLDHGIYSLFCDCLDLGLGDEAKEILHKLTVSTGERRN